MLTMSTAFRFLPVGQLCTRGRFDCRDFRAEAIGRIVSDTSFGVSPRKSIATAVIAALSWVVFFVMLFHGRREVLVRIRR